jgi:hypothetical protein
VAMVARRRSSPDTDKEVLLPALSSESAKVG